MRDYALGTTFDLKFTTRRFTTGSPFTLAGSPAVAAYPDNSTTEITAGITLSVDFDTRTGLNNVRVVATSGNGYAAGSNYSLVITAGTVDSVSVVGEVIGEFSLEAQSPLRPTTAGRTLGVDAAGRVDLGLWLGVAPLALTTQLVQVSVGAMQAGVITAASIAANAFEAAKFAADYFTAIITAVWTTAATRTLTAFGFGVTVTTNNDKTGYTLSAAGNNAVRDTILSDSTPFAGANINATISSRATPAQVNAEVVDALATDTYAEPTGVPGNTVSLAEKIGRNYQALIKGTTVDSATQKIGFKNAAGTIIWEKDYTDDGTVYDESAGNAP